MKAKYVDLIGSDSPSVIEPYDECSTKAARRRWKFVKAIASIDLVGSEDDPAVAFVYFMQCDTGAIKIGFSANLKRRLRQLDNWLRIDRQCRWNSADVRLMAFFRAFPAMEGFIHELFSDYRIGRTEWFLPDPSLLSLIDDIRAEQGQPEADFRAYDDVTWRIRDREDRACYEEVSARLSGKNPPVVVTERVAA